ncbi:MAG: efflux RND transporter periplasmic adaptor subunit, partial [Candidatus Eremiobacteraeota bacterium]|nr:efflux RND transporter periplasmic adaptor subunit [Candidatus Eremiobacteraeota bacterium]
TIGDLSRVWLVANVREADARAIRVGVPALVRVLAYPEKTFEARVSYVAPSLDPTTHRLVVRATLDNPGGLLKPEMFASFRILTGNGSAALGVPEDAVVYEGEVARVYVVGANNTLGLRRIRMGATSDGVVEVLGGLHAGEQVVTSGSVFIDRAAQGTPGD